MKFKTIVALILMLPVAIFSVQNAGVITVRFLHWHFELSQALVILLSAMCGVVIGLGIAAGSSLSRKSRPAERPNSSEKL